MRSATIVAVVASAYLLGGCADVVDMVDWRDDAIVAPNDPWPEPCFEVPEAIRNGDIDDLAWYGIPATIDPDIITGEFAVNHCMSSQPGGLFTVTVTRDSGQVIVFRNSTEPWAEEDPNNPRSPEGLAVRTLGDRVGAYAVTGADVVELVIVPPDDGGVPIGEVLASHFGG